MTELASDVNTDQVGSLSPVGPDLYFLSDFGLLEEVVVKECRTLMLNGLICSLRVAKLLIKHISLSKRHKILNEVFLVFV